MDPRSDVEKNKEKASSSFDVFGIGLFYCSGLVM
jgi:hypothetical protein